MFENFKRVTTGLDVDPLLAALDRNPVLWQEHTQRQSFPDSPHKDTESIILRWSTDHSIEAAFKDPIAVDHPAFQWLPETRNLLQALMLEVKGEQLGRVIIARLAPHGFIEAHVDEGAYADTYERFHVVLASLPGNAFFVGKPTEYGEFVHMQKGEAWWFNHKQPHWAVNATTLPRVHLIADIVAPAYRRERTATPVGVKSESYS